MNIHLTKHFEQFIADKVGSGLYNNASEVVRAGLRALEQQEAAHQLQLQALRAEIARGLEGGSVPFDADSIRRRGRESGKAAKEAT